MAVVCRTDHREEGSALFTPVRRVRGSRQVVEQIRRLVEEGTLRPGQRLPAERELAGQFGVSRATLREAVQSLASLGLLEVRQGIGTVVSPHATTLEDPAYWLPWLSAHLDDVVALLEVREALEAKAAELAAEGVAAGAVGAELLEQAEANLAGMGEAAAAADIGSLERWDLEFHALLAELSGNKYLLRLSRSVNHVFADRRAVMAIPGRAVQSVAEHHRILEAVRAGDALGAAQTMAQHIASTKATVMENLAVPASARS
jgi:GntR family transcriptional repressor for pyruvate dehydrogenase complex